MPIFFFTTFDFACELDPNHIKCQLNVAGAPLLDVFHTTFLVSYLFSKSNIIYCNYFILYNNYFIIYSKYQNYKLCGWNEGDEVMTFWVLGRPPLPGRSALPLSFRLDLLTKIKNIKDSPESLPPTTDCKHPKLKTKITHVRISRRFGYLLFDIWWKTWLEDISSNLNRLSSNLDRLSSNSRYNCDWWPDAVHV